MKLWIPSGSAMGAWLKSLPIVLLFPAALFGIIRGEFSAAGYRPLLITHLIAYAVLSLPVFRWFYPFPEARVWKFPYAGLCGAILGVLGIHFVMLLIYLRLGAPPRDLPSVGLALIGAGYGVCSGAAAWLTRPGGGGEDDAAAGANPPTLI